MQGGVFELARKAAAAARSEPAAQEAAKLPLVARIYHGVVKCGDRYVVEIMDSEGIRKVFLGSYATPEEAGYAYDAAARSMHGNMARPHFPEPSVLPVTGEGGVREAKLLPQARLRPCMPAPHLYCSQQPVPASVGAAQRQTIPNNRAPHTVVLAIPAGYSPLCYPAAGSASTAGGRNGAGFHRMPSMAGANVAPEPEEPMPAYPASSAPSISVENVSMDDAPVRSGDGDGPL